MIAFTYCFSHTVNAYRIVIINNTIDVIMLKLGNTLSPIIVAKKYTIIAGIANLLFRHEELLNLIIKYIQKKLSNRDIVGRVDDVINIRAHKIYPTDVEHCIMSVSDVSECIVTSINCRNEDIMCCLYVADNDIGTDIKKKLVNILTSYEIPKLFVRTDEISKTNTGKPSILRIKEMLIAAVGRK